MGKAGISTYRGARGFRMEYIWPGVTAAGVDRTEVG